MPHFPTEGTVYARIALSVFVPCLLFVGAQFAPLPPAPLHVYGPLEPPQAHGACPTATVSTDRATCASLVGEECAGCAQEACTLRGGDGEGTRRLQLSVRNPSAAPACAVRLVVAPSGGPSMRHGASDLVGRDVLRRSDCMSAESRSVCSLEVEPWSGWDAALVRRGKDHSSWQIVDALHLTVLKLDGASADPTRFVLAIGLFGLASILLSIYLRGQARRRDHHLDAASHGAVGAALGVTLPILIPREFGGLGVAGPIACVVLGTATLVGAGVGVALAAIRRRRALPLPAGLLLVWLVFCATLSVGTLLTDAQDLSHWPATHLRITYGAYIVSAGLAPLVLVTRTVPSTSDLGGSVPRSSRLPLGVAVVALALCPVLGGALSDTLHLSGAIAGLRGLGPPLEAFVSALAMGFLVVGVGWGSAEGAAVANHARDGELGRLAAIRLPLLLVEAGERLCFGEISLEMGRVPGGSVAPRSYEVLCGGEASHGRLRAEVIATLEAVMRRPELAAVQRDCNWIRVGLVHAAAADTRIEGRSYQLALALAASELAAGSTANHEPIWIATGCVDADLEGISSVEGIAVKATAIGPGRVLIAPPGARLESQPLAERCYIAATDYEAREVATRLSRRGALDRGALVEVKSLSAAIALTRGLRGVRYVPRSAPSANGVLAHVG
jgi:hypothetical protein